jgi:uncharacterized protein (TIGR02444 family)
MLQYRDPWPLARNLIATISPLMAAVADIPLSDATSDLWQFSLEFYARPGVSASLIELQDRFGLDVNLILFALWHGLSGRGGLDGKRLAVADDAVRAVQSDIITPLRALRRRLRTDPDADIQCLRDGIEALELDAEKIAQTRLGGGAGLPAADIDPAERLADAQANLTLYLGADLAHGAAAAVIRRALERVGAIV